MLSHNSGVGFLRRCGSVGDVDDRFLIGSYNSGRHCNVRQESFRQARKSLFQQIDHLGIIICSNGIQDVLTFPRISLRFHPVVSLHSWYAVIECFTASSLPFSSLSCKKDQGSHVSVSPATTTSQVSSLVFECRMRVVPPEEESTA